jgi:putative Ca2+/H+ antiporter (TMEM165/GDT1 family)
MTAIALGANYNFMGILLAGVVAHTLCVVLAILLGMLIETFCSEVWLKMASGIMFLVFGMY